MKITHVETVRDFQELGARIRHVRVGMGLDQTKLARESGLDRSALSRIESGDRKVSALELSSIATALGVTFVDLVSVPDPAVVAARRPVEEAPTSSEREEFRAGLEIDRAWRELSQLRESGLISPVPLPFGGDGVSSREAAQDLAREVRKFLGLADGPLGDIVDVAASLGLWCRTTSARIDGASLTPEPGLGVAVVGEDLEPGRRRATIAHEIGHHVCGDTYEAPGRYNAPRKTEAFIDAFAAELLLPAAVIRALGVATRDALVDVAARYRVSWSLVVSTARQLDVDLAQADVSLTPVDEDFYRVVGARPVEDVLPPGLPREWIKTCIKARDKGLITPVRAAELTAGVIGG